MSIKIREAKCDDAPLLARAESEITKTPGLLASQPHELKESSFKDKIVALSQINNGKYVVAERDGQILGHAFLDPMGRESIAHVVRLTIAVHPGFEEHGIGETMLRHLVDWAKTTEGVEKIELNVRAINTRAIRLYQKLGFTIEGRIRNRMKLNDGRITDDLEMGLFVKGQTILPTVVSLPIGKVISSRSEVVDDSWDEVQAHVELDSRQFTERALFGLDSFSHIEVLFHMDQVDVRKIETSSRHPRNNPEWPEVGIFAQRGKNRPNQIGLTICRLLMVG